MFTHPHVASELGREHQRQMLADASQRQLRHQLRHRADRTPNAVGRITRHLVTAVASMAALRMPGRIEPHGTELSQ